MNDKALLEKMGNMLKILHEGQAQIITTLKALEAGQLDIQDELKEVNIKFSKIDVKFNKVDVKLNELNVKIEEVNLKVEILNARATKTDAVVNKIDDGLAVMQPKVFEITRDHDERIKKLEKELGHLRN